MNKIDPLNFLSGHLLRHRLISTLIFGCPQRLTWFEMGYTFLRNIHGVATARVTAKPRCTVHDRKTAEPSDLDPVSAHHCVIHRIQNGRHGGISIALRQLTEPGCKKLNKV
jgi:hypothetical protein